MRLERHPLSALWGDMPEEDFTEMRDSVREHGLHFPIILLYEGKVLDGWHRYRAANMAGRDYSTAEYKGGDPASFVIARNAHRRHLTAGQRAACVVACHEWARSGVDTGRLKGGETIAPPSTVAEMAEEAGVSERTLQHAKVAEAGGLGDAVRAGEMPVHKAAAQVRGEPDEPKPPTRTERLEAQADALKMEVQEKAFRIQDLEEQLEFFQGEGSSRTNEREVMFNRQQAVISALRSQLGESQAKHNDERRRANWWEKQAKALGWESTKPKTTATPKKKPLYVDAPVETVDEVTKVDRQATLQRQPYFEESQWHEGFRCGAEVVVKDTGEHVIFHGKADDGVRGLIGTEYGLGKILPIEMDRLSIVEGM